MFHAVVAWEEKATKEIAFAELRLLKEPGKLSTAVRVTSDCSGLAIVRSGTALKTLLTTCTDLIVLQVVS